jgi:hypothetical protein
MGKLIVLWLCAVLFASVLFIQLQLFLWHGWHYYRLMRQRMLEQRAIKRAA